MKIYFRSNIFISLFFKLPLISTFSSYFKIQNFFHQVFLIKIISYSLTFWLYHGFDKNYVRKNSKIFCALKKLLNTI